MSKALTARDPAAEIEAIKDRVTQLEAGDLGIVHSMNRAFDFDENELALYEALTDEELEQKGWTRRELRVAKAANRPRSDVPYALQAAQERTLARTRRHVEEAGGARINIQGGTFNILAPGPRKTDAEVRIVDVNEAKH